MLEKIVIAVFLIIGVNTSTWGKALTQVEIAAIMIPIYSLILDSEPVEAVPPAPIKKTGQTVSYTDDGIANTTTLKDDGHYRRGVDISYTRDAAKEIVTDHVTGLQWQDDHRAKYTKKQWITYANFDASASNDPNINTSGDTATTHCSELELGGYSDWRLPTIIELQSIFHYTSSRPTLNPIFHFVQGSYDDGDSYGNARYWTSTKSGRATQQYNAWTIDFYFGQSMLRLKNQEHFVRCVRKENN